MPNEEKQSFYSNTLDAVSSGDLQEVVNVAYEAIQRPIIITDPAYKVLAVQPNEKIGDDIYWDEQIEHGYTPIPLIISGHRNQFRQKALSGDGITVLYENTDLQYPRLVGNVVVHDSVQSFISILYTDKSFPTDADKEIMRFLCKACALVIQNSSDERFTNSSVQANFVSILFAGQQLSAEELQEWEELSGIHLHGNFAILAMSPTYPDEYTIEYLIALLRPTNPILISHFQDGYRYFLINGIKGWEGYRDLCVQLNDILEKLHLRASISHIFNNVEDIRFYVYRAKAAYDVGYLNDSMLSVFDDVQEKIILNQSLRFLKKPTCTHSIWQMLMDYDKEYNTTYYQSLSVYLNCMCNSHLAAQTLCIHRNTMLYRLNKINDICHCDLSDPKLCRRLMVSLWVLELAEQINSGDKAFS